MTVLVIGDANVDLDIRLPVDSRAKEHANPDPQLLGGGSAANTAAALARLGIDCRFAGAVGDDSFGRFAVASLETAGVDTTWITTTPDLPTVTVITVKQPDGERLIYVWPPSGGAHAALEVETATAALTGVEWLHVSGICLRVLPAREALLAAMARARADGILVSFDLNLRLENWGWDDGFRDVAMAAVARSDVVLGAANDEVGTLAGKQDPVAAARALSDGRRTVVARLGAAGAVACSEGLVVAENGFEVAVVDTVGAGDAFNAGFIAARLEGGTMAEALQWGNAVAALTIGRAGARSTPMVAQLASFLRQ
jgi:sugar/nucleoside kinase (ribokinase family)